MNQEVVDGLVEAVEKKDVLYVLVYLDDMREQGWLEQGVNAKHSKKRNTAIEAMAQFFSPRQYTSHLILDILLLSGAKYSPEDQIGGDGIQATQPFLTMLESWDSIGKEQAKYAELLLTLGPVAASDWIDGLLSLPTLGGDRSSSTPPHSPPISPSSRITIGIARIPQNYSKRQLKQLFHENGIPLRILLCETTTKETYAFVDVEYGEAVEKCFQALDGSELEGKKLRFFPSNDLTESVLARLGIPPVLKTLPLISPPKSLPKIKKPPSPQKPSGRKSYTLLIFGLPLQASRSTFETYRFSTCVIRQSQIRRCSVAILTFAKKSASQDVKKAYTALCEGKGCYLGLLMEPEMVTLVLDDWLKGMDNFGLLEELNSARPVSPKRSQSEQSRDESSDQSSDESSPSESDSPPPRKRPRKKKIPPSDYPSFSTSPPPYSSCPPRPVPSIGYKCYNPLPPHSHAEEFSYPPGFERNPNQEEYLRKRWVQRTGRSYYIAEQEPPGILDYGAGF